LERAGFHRTGFPGVFYLKYHLYRNSSRFTRSRAIPISRVAPKTTPPSSSTAQRIRLRSGFNPHALPALLSENWQKLDRGNSAWRPAKLLVDFCRRRRSLARRSAHPISHERIRRLLVSAAPHSLDRGQRASRASGIAHWSAPSCKAPFRFSRNFRHSAAPPHSRVPAVPHLFLTIRSDGPPPSAGPKPPQFRTHLNWRSRSPRRPALRFFHRCPFPPVREIRVSRLQALSGILSAADAMADDHRRRSRRSAARQSPRSSIPHSKSAMAVALRHVERELLSNSNTSESTTLLQTKCQPAPASEKAFASHDHPVTGAAGFLAATLRASSSRAETNVRVLMRPSSTNRAIADLSLNMSPATCAIPPRLDVP